MKTPDLITALEATWLPVETAGFGGLIVSRGAGGGGRLSSVRVADGGAGWDDADLAAALAQQDVWGEARLIRARDTDDRLAAAAARQGLKATKPTVILSAPLDVLADRDPPFLTSFTVWPPLAIQREVWAAHGISAPRQAAMQRGDCPRTAMLARKDNRPAGAGYCAVSGPVAGLHALVVASQMRGARLGEWMIRHAARWALDQGAQYMALAVARGNAPALRMYERLGFQEVAGYVYFRKP